MIERVKWLVVSPSGVTNVGGEITAYFSEKYARRQCASEERLGSTCTLWRVIEPNGIPEEVSL